MVKWQSILLVFILLVFSSKLLLNMLRSIYSCRILWVSRNIMPMKCHASVISQLQESPTSIGRQIFIQHSVCTLQRVFTSHKILHPELNIRLDELSLGFRVPSMTLSPLPLPTALMGLWVLFLSGQLKSPESWNRYYFGTTRSFFRLFCLQYQNNV